MTQLDTVLLSTQICTAATQRIVPKFVTVVDLDMMISPQIKFQNSDYYYYFKYFVGVFCLFPHIFSKISHRKEQIIFMKEIYSESGIESAVP